MLMIDDALSTDSCANISDWKSNSISSDDHSANAPFPQRKATSKAALTILSLTWRGGTPCSVSLHTSSAANTMAD